MCISYKDCSGLREKSELTEGLRGSLWLIGHTVEGKGEARRSGNGLP